jgi:hypothetical protein
MVAPRKWKEGYIWRKEDLGQLAQSYSQIGGTSSAVLMHNKETIVNNYVL